MYSGPGSIKGKDYHILSKLSFTIKESITPRKRGEILLDINWTLP